MGRRESRRAADCVRGRARLVRPGGGCSAISQTSCSVIPAPRRHARWPPAHAQIVVGRRGPRVPPRPRTRRAARAPCALQTLGDDDPPNPAPASSFAASHLRTTSASTAALSRPSSTAEPSTTNRGFSHATRRVTSSILRPSPVVTLPIVVLRRVHSRRGRNLAVPSYAAAAAENVTRACRLWIIKCALTGNLSRQRMVRARANLNDRHGSSFARGIGKSRSPRFMGA